MDWSKVTISTPRNPRPQVGELGLLDYWKLVVASKLLRKSIAAVLQTAVYTYVGRTWEDHEQRLIVEAQARGITPEELFMALTQED